MTTHDAPTDTGDVEALAAELAVVTEWADVGPDQTPMRVTVEMVAKDVLASDWLAADRAAQRADERERIIAAIRSYAEGFAFPQQGELWRQVAEYVETWSTIARAGTAGGSDA